MNLKKLASLFLFGVLILALGVFWWQTRPERMLKYTGPVQDVRLGVSAAGQQLSALIYIADKKGYFTDNKLNVIFTVDANSTASRKNVSEGSEDLGTTSDFAFVGDSFTPTNLRILAVISNSRLIEIIGRKDKGITKDSNLKGKKVALTTKSSGEFFFGEFLAFNNLKLSDVTVVPSDFSKAQAAIIDGTVDAVVSNDPFAYQIKQKLGENAVQIPTQINRNNNLLLISNEKFVQEKPEAIERFLSALIQAEDFAKANPQESKKIIGDKFKFDQAFLDQNWPKNSFTVSLSQSLLLGMEDEARFMIANQLTDKTNVPNFNDFIYKDALRKVKLEAVTLY